MKWVHGSACSVHAFRTGGSLPELYTTCEGTYRLRTPTQGGTFESRVLTTLVFLTEVVAQPLIYRLSAAVRAREECQGVRSLA
jgi:hypothetical protein